METTNTITAKTPWAPFMRDIPLHLDYFEGSMFDKVADIAARYPNYVAFDFMGRSTTVSMLCFSMTRPHLGQWGVPQRA